MKVGPKGNNSSEVITVNKSLQCIKRDCQTYHSIWIFSYYNNFFSYSDENGGCFIMIEWWITL